MPRSPKCPLAAASLNCARLVATTRVGADWPAHRTRSLISPGRRVPRTPARGSTALGRPANRPIAAASSGFIRCPPAWRASRCARGSLYGRPDHSTASAQCTSSPTAGCFHGGTSPLARSVILPGVAGRQLRCGCSARLCIRWAFSELVDGQGWVRTNPSGTVSSGCLSRHSRTTSGRYGIRAPKMNDNPALAGRPGWLRRSSRRRRPPSRQ